MEELVKISVNNWIADVNYPDTEFFRSMLDRWGTWSGFTHEYCMENHICAYHGYYDMSENLVMVAPKEWVEANCPELLTEEKYKHFVYGDDKYTDRVGFAFPYYPFDEEESPTPYGNFYYDYDTDKIDWRL